MIAGDEKLVELDGIAIVRVHAVKGSLELCHCLWRAECPGAPVGEGGAMDEVRFWSRDGFPSWEISVSINGKPG